MKQWLKELFHNCVMHPLLPFLPKKLGDDWHERNGIWTYGEDK